MQDQWSSGDDHQYQWVQYRLVLVLIFFIKLFCFVVAMSDLVHDVEAIHGLC